MWPTLKINSKNIRAMLLGMKTLKTPETGTVCVFYSVGKANYIVISKYISVLTVKVIRLCTFFYKILLNKPETRLNFFLPPPLPPFMSNGTRHFFHPFSCRNFSSPPQQAHLGKLIEEFRLRYCTLNYSVLSWASTALLYKSYFWINIFYAETG